MMLSRSGLLTAALVSLSLLFTACDRSAGSGTEADPADAADLVNQYEPVRLAPSLEGLSSDQQEAVGLLIEAAHEMEAVFAAQAYGQLDSLLETLDNEAARRYVQINYGPWDRLDGNEPFIAGVGEKPAGANFYPAEMTKEEFEQAAAEDEALKSLYTMVRRDSTGSLVAIPYSEYFAEKMERAAEKLRAAADLVENDGFADYLRLRADALLSDEYQESDMAWMDLADNDLEVVIGPIETYEDQLFGYKAAAETFVLRKDREWSQRLSRYAELLPMLQRGLPVPDEYKQETPGTDSDLGAYDVLYVSGDANAGSKTIAINLPNDEEVQLQKGTRRLQLKNAMRAKFDQILVPISEELIAEDQRQHVTFDAFFGNTMFHEVAHGLGIKKTIDGSGRTVREALRDQASAMEEGKADVLGLYMITALDEEGEVDGELMDNYVSFLASIFRSVRFGASSAHGKANMIRFNYFNEHGAFSRDSTSGTYRVDEQKMREAMNELSEEILRLQGDGDYEAVTAFVEQYGGVSEQLQADLDRLAEAGIPVDIVYEQGPDVLGLEQTVAATE